MNKRDYLKFGRVVFNVGFFSTVSKSHRRRTFRADELHDLITYWKKVTEQVTYCPSGHKTNPRGVGLTFTKIKLDIYPIRLFHYRILIK